MRRTVTLTASCAVASFLALYPLALSQDFGRQPQPPAQAEMPGRQLIAWSELQKPQPLPQISNGIQSNSEEASAVAGTAGRDAAGCSVRAADSGALGAELGGNAARYVGERVKVVSVVAGAEH
ncbi:MAG TPA: hypothetical protein VMD76_14470 [Candidatus Sulfotelmatobacter sp.]|nr:hypothetical protein [Candidatus Sulfotelmatobacter sp.]